MTIEQERTFEVPPTSVCRDVSEILARINDKWSVRILRILRGERVRFNELQRQLEGITHKMLAQTLRGLQRDGLVRRELTPTVPPRTDYELTALGRSALEPLDALAGWALRNREQVHTARSLFDGSECSPAHAGRQLGAESVGPVTVPEPR